MFASSSILTVAIIFLNLISYQHALFKHLLDSLDVKSDLLSVSVIYTRCYNWLLNRVFFSVLQSSNFVYH